jgi:tripartite-type tricarboxylate transporter receptor subunit TctC
MRTLFAAIAAIVLLAPPASAQDWPSRPVRLIVPFAAGGFADIIGRTIAQNLSKTFGQQFFVENRTGAGGLIGAAAIVGAPPDGYNLVISGVASHVVAPAVSAKPGFDAMRDFTHIAYLGGPPIVLVVNSQFGISSYQQFIQKAKSEQKGLNYVSPGVGTHAHLLAEHMAAKEGIKLSHVPYKGSVPALTDLLAGHVPIGAMTWSSPAPHIRSGAVRGLAVTSERRPASAPDIPTFRELGHEDLVAATWFSLSGPAKMPADIVQALNRAVEKGLHSSEIKELFDKEGVEVRPMTPDVFVRFVESEAARWAPIAKALSRVK